MNTRYKRKGEKELPVDKSDPSGKGSSVAPDWRLKVLKKYYNNEWSQPVPVEGEYKNHIIPKVSGIARGARLVPERLEGLKMGNLWPKEREFLTEVLYTREAALAWNFEEAGMLRPEVSPPIEVRTVKHEPWRDRGIPVPRAIKPIAAKMNQERIDNGILEYSAGAYSNNWFLIPKSPGRTGEKRYRLINSCTKMNGVTLKDANVPPSAEEFSEEFSGMKVSSVIDLFSGYDQIPFDPKSRDMTAFLSPLEKVRKRHTEGKENCPGLDDTYMSTFEIPTEPYTIWS